MYSVYPIFNDDKFRVDFLSIPIVAHCRSGFLRRLLIFPSCLYISRFRFVVGDTTARVNETQDLSFSIEQSRVRKAMLAAGTIRDQWNEEIVRHWMIVWTTHRPKSSVTFGCNYTLKGGERATESRKYRVPGRGKSHSSKCRFRWK